MTMTIDEELAFLTGARDDLNISHRKGDIEKIKNIILNINDKNRIFQHFAIWQKYYLARAHTLMSDMFYKGKTEEAAYNHARSAVDAVSGLERPADVDADADAEIYALLSGALGRMAAGAGDPISKAGIGMRSDRALARALELAPRNPRVLAIHGRSQLLKPRLFGGNKRNAIAILAEARAIALDESRRPAPLPDWGLEEACFWLAYGLLHFNRFDDARDALGPLLEGARAYYLVQPMLERIAKKEGSRQAV